MNIQKTKTILVYPSRGSVSPVLWDALSRLVPVTFQDYSEGHPIENQAAVIFINEDEIISRQATAAGIKTFVFTPSGSQEFQDSKNGRVDFSNHGYVDQRLRGRSIVHQALEEAKPLEIQPGDQILASYQQRPIWLLRPGVGAPTEICSVSLPTVKTGEHPVDHLNGWNFIRLLPILHFLRSISSDLAWSAPPLKACFMFDDPNLHWDSYGYIPYRQVLRDAKAHQFHVAFATVPLDAWWAHGSTARLFRENPTHLSLLFHGNDHTKAELSRPRSPEEHAQLLAQSLRRITDLERRVGFSVARAMAPPHGAYAEATMPAMLSLGFEGACISPWSLRDWSPNRNWPPTLGLEIAERMDAEFYVIPRFAMSSTCQGHIMISAFLDRPIIPLGHHDTLSNGVQMLSDIAAVINSLDGVTWGNPAEVLRSSYLKRQEGTLLRIRPYSSLFNVSVPPGVTALVIEPSSSQNSAATWDFVVERLSPDLAPNFSLKPGETLPVICNEQLEIRSSGLGSLDFMKVKAPRSSLWPLARRILCETRDRMAPLIPKRKAA